MFAAREALYRRALHAIQCSLLLLLLGMRIGSAD